MENSQLFTNLFHKYLDNRCSPEEVEYLMELIQSGKYNTVARQLIESRLREHPISTSNDEVLKNRFDKRLQAILSDDSSITQVRSKKIHWLPWAAAACIIIAIAGVYRFVSQKQEQVTIANAQPQIKTDSTATYVRYLTLPDGSTVVLHAGSKLEYPSSFTSDNREVTLIGEAYFDVAHDPKKPFVIFTGKVKTTVLGTAFNIRSDEKQVTVSVTRGKVKVEDGSKVLAVLSPDQQVKYNVPEAKSEQVTVNAKSIVTGWASENMVFDGISFDEIAQRLTKRYGVQVSFKNESLKKCKIRASFLGTERLDQVASVLSGIKNGRYEQLPDGSIVFEGNGCD